MGEVPAQPGLFIAQRAGLSLLLLGALCGLILFSSNPVFDGTYRASLSARAAPWFFAGLASFAVSLPALLSAHWQGVRLPLAGLAVLVGGLAVAGGLVPEGGVFPVLGLAAVAALAALFGPLLGIWLAAPVLSLPLLAGVAGLLLAAPAFDGRLPAMGEVLLFLLALGPALWQLGMVARLISGQTGIRLASARAFNESLRLALFAGLLFSGGLVATSGWGAGGEGAGLTLFAMSAALVTAGAGLALLPLKEARAAEIAEGWAVATALAERLARRLNRPKLSAMFLILVILVTAIVTGSKAASLPGPGEAVVLAGWHLALAGLVTAVSLSVRAGLLVAASLPLVMIPALALAGLFGMSPASAGPSYLVMALLLTAFSLFWRDQLRAGWRRREALVPALAGALPLLGFGLLLAVALFCGFALVLPEVEGLDENILVLIIAGALALPVLSAGMSVIERAVL